MSAPSASASAPIAPDAAPAVSPLRNTMARVRVPEPQVLVLFGGTGDLARRKLIPALFRLEREGFLPERFAILGSAREDLTDEEYRERMREAMAEFAEAPPAEEWARFAGRMCFVGGISDDPEGFVRLRRRLEEVDAERGTGGSRVFFLAVPPGVVEGLAENLGRAGLVHAPGGAAFSRIVVEKPFGHDLESARALNQALLKVFDEGQIFRIDHYLGKETVQNLLVFRFSNVIWEPVWSRTYVDHVQITVGETVGVEQRAGYYEMSGALRDMVQSHLLQLLALVAMEPPASYDADSIRGEKVKVLRAIRPIRGEDVARETVRGQYAASGDGTMAGYREEPKVAADSRTETFAALRLFVDNWRWAGVPFYLRTGKRLPARATEMVVRFRPAPHPILDLVEGDVPEPNALVLRVQPEEGISLFFEAKVPGMRGSLRPVSMDFDYCRAFGVDSPEAYQRLLLDAMLGDATLFTRRDEVEAAWTLVTPILEAWEADGEPEPYPAGTWGPEGSERLIGGDGRRWRVP
jgi:glucose-6-phosphate 1-dehydrogenase